jgi:hypothetical protein
MIAIHNELALKSLLMTLEKLDVMVGKGPKS